MKDLVEFVARSLVDDPTQVHLEESRRGQSVHFDLEVAKEDMGKIIGKHGRTAQAIRTLLSAASGKAKKRIVLEILE
jgi:predicted RNA-binding protein YlqC (UPF0109 family)